MGFHGTTVLLKSASGASKRWLARQSKDPYVKERYASAANYRSRSAFKLAEIDQKWNILNKDDVGVVVDLGAAPGGWSQVVAGKLGWLPAAPKPRKRAPRPKSKDSKQRWKDLKNLESTTAKGFDPLNINDVDEQVHGRGVIVALDLLRMEPINGVHTIQVDFLSERANVLLQKTLLVNRVRSEKVDVVLSDMAANLTGNVIRDTESSLDICHAVFNFAQRHLRTAQEVGRPTGGVLLMKHFDHPLLHKFRNEILKSSFRDVHFIKPDASRSESSEGYFLCRGWHGSLIDGTRSHNADGIISMEAHFKS